MRSTFQNMLLNIQIIPGYGEVRVGSVYVSDYVVMGDKPRAVMTKVDVTALDHKNMSVTFTVIKGELKNGFTSFASTHTSTPTQIDGNYKCLVKWSARFQKANEDVPDPTYIKKWVEDFFKELDTNLLKEEERY
ncbi:hypothetical protein C5167_007417 [Papaver somniferum]|uniref:MLP-like protein 423 n=1 Tax=Papaver somniferum TaxID=3469 RepID=UPI000E704E89|nr:MLP-like protein 423 [Papaver somniferum]RZC86227.1 hypothetical protein C5167_007417 [Papaver somniferum]